MHDDAPDPQLLSIAGSISDRESVNWDDLPKELRADQAAIVEQLRFVESVARLRKQPETYQAMIERGRERGRDFAREAIAARWIALLQETGGLGPARASLYTHLVAILRQKRAAKHFRRLHARDLRHALAAK